MVYRVIAIRLSALGAAGAPCLGLVLRAFSPLPVFHATWSRPMAPLVSLSRRPALRPSQRLLESLKKVDNTESRVRITPIYDKLAPYFAWLMLSLVSLSPLLQPAPLVSPPFCLPRRKVWRMPLIQDENAPRPLVQPP